MIDYQNPTDLGPSTHYCAVCSAAKQSYIGDPYELRMDDGRGGIIKVSMCGEHARALADRIREDLDELAKIDDLVKAVKEEPPQPCAMPQTQTLTIQGPPELMATVKSVTIEFKEGDE